MNKPKEDGMAEEICTRRFQNYAYTMYRVDKYSNAFACEFLVIGCTDGKRYYGHTAEEAENSFKEQVKGEISFVESTMPPLSGKEIELLKTKIDKNKRLLIKTLVKEHYLSEDNSNLTMREIYCQHDCIKQLLCGNDRVEVVYKIMDRYIGGYLYILLNKKYESDTVELKRIEENLNEKL